MWLSQRLSSLYHGEGLEGSNNGNIDRLELVRTNDDMIKRAKELGEMNIKKYNIRNVDNGKELSSKQYQWLYQFCKDFGLFERMSMEPTYTILQKAIKYESYQRSRYALAASGTLPWKTTWSSKKKEYVQGQSCWRRSEYLGGDYCEVFGEFTAYNPDGDEIASMGTYSMVPARDRTGENRIDAFHGLATFYPEGNRGEYSPSFSIMFDINVPLYSTTKIM